MKDILAAVFLFFASVLLVAAFAIMLVPMLAAEEHAVSIFAAAIIFSPAIFFLTLILKVIGAVTRKATVKTVSEKLPVFYFSLAGIVTATAVIISLF